MEQESQWRIFTLHSIQDLNGYSESSVEYQDDRPYVGTYTLQGNQSVTVDQAQSFVVPVGGNVISLISAPNTIVYTVNVSAANSNVAPFITWPHQSTVTHTSANGVFTAGNITTVDKWDTIKAPTIVLGNDEFYGNFTYTSNINDGQGNVTSWTTNVTVNQITSATRSYTYAEDQPVALTFSITDPDVRTATDIQYIFQIEQWTTPGANSPTSGGRFIVDGTYGTRGENLFISNSKAYINARSISYEPPLDYTGSISLLYRVTKVIYGYPTNAIEYAISMTNVSSHSEYTKPTSLSGVIRTNVALNGFSITDVEAYPGEKLYTITLDSSNTALGSFYWKGIYKNDNFSITDTKANINAGFSDAGTYYAGGNTVANTTISFTLVRTNPDGATLANAVTTTLSLVEPTLGQSWQGGTYVGKIASTGGSLDYRMVTYQPARYTWRFASDADAYITVALNSANNGYTNTETLYNQLSRYPTTVIGEHWTMSYNGYSDWYVPSYNELNTAMNNVPSAFPAPHAYWSSTVVTSSMPGVNYHNGTYNFGVKVRSSEGGYVVYNWSSIIGYLNDPGDSTQAVGQPFRRIAI